MSITVGKLKQQLQDTLDTLNDLEDSQKIRLESNTYFLGNARVFIGIAGHDGGYLNLNAIEDNLIDDEDNE